MRFSFLSNRLFGAGILSILSVSVLRAQTTVDSINNRPNVINTAVPFLRIAPDARSGAMGDAGLALSPDANAMFWNTAKLSFAENKWERQLLTLRGFGN